MNACTTIDSPIGRLLLHSDGAALTGLYMDVPAHLPRGMDAWVEDRNAGPLPETIRQLGEYFAGRRREFDLPWRLHGTEFQQRVWNALMEIPYGATWSYGELAKRLSIAAATCIACVGSLTLTMYQPTVPLLKLRASSK